VAGQRQAKFWHNVSRTQPASDTALRLPAGFMTTRSLLSHKKHPRCNLFPALDGRIADVSVWDFMAAKKNVNQDQQHFEIQRP